MMLNSCTHMTIVGDKGLMGFGAARGGLIDFCQLTSCDQYLQLSNMSGQN